MALLVCRVSQKFVPLISCAIPFDQNYTFTRKFFKIVFALLSACIGKFNIPHAAVCFLSHSVAVAALSRISHLACRARDFLLGLSEPSFQILHGVRSWIFIDTFIHYAPQFLHSVCSWRILGPAYCRYKIWQVVVVVVVFFFVPCLGGFGCVCWRPVLDEAFKVWPYLLCRRSLALLRPPNNIIFRIGQLNSSAVRFLYCLTDFKPVPPCVAVSRRFFCLQPSLFMNPQTVFFLRTVPLLANCFRAASANSPLQAFVRIFLDASFRNFCLPVLFLSSKPSFLEDHFTIPNVTIFPAFFYQFFKLLSQ